MDELLRILRDKFGTAPFTAKEALLANVPFEDFFPKVAHTMARVARGEPGASMLRSVGCHLRTMDGLTKVGLDRNQSALWRVK